MSPLSRGREDVRLPSGMLPLTITVLHAESPMDVNEDDAVTLEVGDPGGIDLDDVREALTALAPGGPYLLDEQRRTTEWGASGEAIEFVLTVGSHAWAGIVGGYAWQALQSIAKRPKSDVDAHRSDEDLQWDARQQVGRRYYADVEAVSDLAVVETTTTTGNDGTETRVVLTAPTGETYIVTTRSNGTTSMSRIERQAPSS